MTKTIPSALTAILLATTIIAAPGMASAQERQQHYGGYDASRYAQGRGRDWRRDDRGRHNDAVGAGIAGLAFGAILGAALSSNQHYGQSGYYGDRYHGQGYDQGAYARRTCMTREQVWDRYQEGYVWVERAIPC